MKFIVSSSLLKAMAAPLHKVINHSAILPILEDFYIHADFDSKKIILTATDLETILTVKLDAEVRESGEVCVPSSLLKSIAKCPEQPLTFVTDKNYKLSVIGDNFTMHVQGESPDNYPKTPAMDNLLATATFEPKDIIPIFRKACIFTSNDDLRPAMEGVKVHKNTDGKLWIVGTDAHRLFYNTMDVPSGFENINCIIAKWPLIVLADHIKSKEPVKITANINHILFEQGPYTLLSRLIDARYPDYNAVIPPELPYSFNLTRKEAKTFVRLAKDFSNRATNQIKLIVDSVNKVITTSAEDVDFSFGFECRLRAYNFNDAPEYTLALNAQFLLDCLNQHNDEYVLIRHSGSPTRAIIVDDQILVMPLMLNQ